MSIDEIIGSIGIEGARYIEEHIDPQFQALLFLYEHMKDKKLFVPLVVANSLVSYQLSGKGEEWWWEFAHYFSENPVVEFSEAYKAFLPESRTNRRLVGTKVKRLKRVDAFLQAMDPDRYYADMVRLRDDLAKVLGTNKSAKTIVFAVKMFGYAMRIATGEFRQYPFEVPIPVDSRIKRITEKLGGGDPTEFWNRIAKETNVPPLHIDSILWPAMSGNKEVREKIRNAFGSTGEELIEILSP